MNKSVRPPVLSGPWGKKCMMLPVITARKQKKKCSKIKRAVPVDDLSVRNALIQQPSRTHQPLLLLPQLRIYLGLLLVAFIVGIRISRPRGGVIRRQGGVHGRARGRLDGAASAAAQAKLAGRLWCFGPVTLGGESTSEPGKELPAAGEEQRGPRGGRRGGG